MKRRIISAAVCTAILATGIGGMSPATASAESWSANTTKTPQYMQEARQMEKLGRGLVAFKTDKNDINGVEGGVYLSWRLLGDESLENQAFDIYKNDVKIHTTGEHDATNWTDTSGTETDSYKVVKAGADETEVKAEQAVKPAGTFRTARDSYVTNGTSEKNAYSYVDIPISRPAPVKRPGDGNTSTYYGAGGANDASVGDLDGDGEYELVLKWEPSDAKDSASSNYTGHVYLDAYEMTADNGGKYKWRIDLGPNVTAGAHYTQFIVYDLDGDGRDEMAVQTAPGSIDGTGRSVLEVGDTQEIRDLDPNMNCLGPNSEGRGKGKNVTDHEFYTVFDGETGKAITTTQAIPVGSSSDWGDSKYNKAMRYLAGVAYLDGVHPSLIECRGYYNRAVVRAYSYDGEALSMQWEYDSGTVNEGLYAQGNHNLSIADIDNDGFDEIVYGSAALHQVGQMFIGRTGYGHVVVMYLNVFNNDGV